MVKLKKDKTIRIRILEDTLSKYIPYCNYGGHPGVPYDNRKCENVNCRYYSKFRMYEKW